MTPTERILTALVDRNCDPKQNGKEWSARCPAHDDQRPSLRVSEGKDGRALVHCHAGCTVPSICEAVGFQVSDLMPTPDTLAMTPQRYGNLTIVATYDYCDENGKLLSQVVRLEPKDFRQRQPKTDGGWDWSVKGVRVVPYRLPELLAEPERPVIIVEGEKDVDNLARLGLLATCNSGGAGTWTSDHASFFRNRHVIVVIDNDEAGRAHGYQVVESLYGIAASIKIVELPGLNHKGDVSDWIAAGGTKVEFEQLVEASPEWTPELRPWPEIESFDDFNLPDFPTDVLPSSLRNWVEAESRATQTPPDLAGLLALAVCSAGIARRVVVEPRIGWREPVNLFVTVLLEPGNRKSAVFTDAIKPLRELEAELIEEARPKVAREQSEQRQDEVRLKKLEKVAAEKGDIDAQGETWELAEKLAKQTDPVLPRLLVDDATSEKLSMMLAEQGGRIASMSPEGDVFDLMAGLYGKSGMPQFGVYLMGHSGDDLITDRVCRNSVRVERPALTCAYAVQPAVIEGLAENSAFRGRGLLARFLYATPESRIGGRQIAPPPVPKATRNAYHKTVQVMAEAECEFTLHLTPDALAAFTAWEAEIERNLDEGGAMEMMRDWGAKLAGATLRLAAVMHCAEFGVTGRINAATLDGAITIGRYLIPHADLVLGRMHAKEDRLDADARYVLRWIKRHARREFTKSEAQHHGKRRFPKSTDIDAALAELVRRSYIRKKPAPPPGVGRPPSPSYEVNPNVINDEVAKRSQNSQNPDPPPEGDNSGNIGNTSPLPQVATRVQVTI